MKFRDVMCGALVAVGIFAGAMQAYAQSGVEALLDKALAGEHRPEAERLRDKYRHPRETLLFFGLTPGMTVVEIWPGSGWYSRILAPVLREKGSLILAHSAIENPKLPGWQRDARVKQEANYTDHSETYGKPLFTSLGPPDFMAIAPVGSADMVITFRNVHNWSKHKLDGVVFKAFFAALKPGGVLGVVEHRAKPGTSFEQQVETGYMTEEYVIALAEKAGFKLVAKSEINANSHDTKDHPKGVWSLPPTLRGFLDQDRFRAIGESDRMTLKFTKSK